MKKGKVITRTPQGKQETECYMHSEFIAIHKGIGWQSRTWTVTHIPTGYGIWSLLDRRKDAVKIANMFNNMIPDSIKCLDAADEIAGYTMSDAPAFIEMAKQIQRKADGIRKVSNCPPESGLTNIECGKDTTLDSLIDTHGICTVSDATFNCECSNCGEWHDLESDGSTVCDCGNQVDSPMVAMGVI